MSFNTIGYLVYLPIIGFITFYVGKRCHTHGLHFVKQAITDETMAIAVNNMLLVGYYLVNIGYAIIGLSSWEYMTGLADLMAIVSTQTAHIVLILAALHYFNILTLFVIRKLKINTQH
jgi:hypothetical protein